MRSFEICEVVRIADAICATGATIKGGEPLKCNFPHSEPTFTTDFAVSTAQILRKNKEPNIIIYSEFHFIL